MSDNTDTAVADVKKWQIEKDIAGSERLSDFVNHLISPAGRSIQQFAIGKVVPLGDVEEGASPKSELVAMEREPNNLPKLSLSHSLRRMSNFLANRVHDKGNDGIENGGNDECNPVAVVFCDSRSDPSSPSTHVDKDIEN